MISVHVMYSSKRFFRPKKWKDNFVELDIDMCSSPELSRQASHP